MPDITGSHWRFSFSSLTVLWDLSHTPVLLFLCLGNTMPVVGVASKLRQPSAVGTKPVHTALPIPSAVRSATSQGYMARQQELRAGEGAPGLSCQLSVKSEYQRERTPEGKSRAETEESKICKVSVQQCVCFVHLCVVESEATLHRCQRWMSLACQAWSLASASVILSFLFLVWAGVSFDQKQRSSIRWWLMCAGGMKSLLFVVIIEGETDE